MSDEFGVRLQKVLSRAGIASRRKAELLIKEGRVSVNGKLVTAPGRKVNPTQDQIKFDGNPVKVRKNNVTLLFHKPRDVVCTRDDPENRKTLFEMLPRKYRELYSVGRLDYATEGLLLLTSDGELANQVAHPSYGCTKIYHVKFKGRLTKAEVTRLRVGVELDDGAVTRPAEVQLLQTSDRNQWYEIAIQEGRNRQLRRMGEAIGHPVLKIKRVAVGNLTLAGVKRGEFRIATANELTQLRQLLAKKRDRSS